MYFEGQRYISEAEPELGLGIIQSINDKQLTIFFPGKNEHKTYGAKSAPLKRITFDIGDQISLGINSKHTVVDVMNDEGLIFYKIENDEVVCETQLYHVVNFNRPEMKLFTGRIDTNDQYLFRLETIQKKEILAKSHVTGLMGGKMELFPHQIYIAEKVTQIQYPRVLLSDEVGLGKTIEAALIAHRLIKMGRAERVLVLVPNSLVHQWFIEFRKRFALDFAVLNEEAPPEPDSNPFEENNLVICSVQLLKGAKMAFDWALNADWDMLIVDEAHHLEWSLEKGASSEYKIVEELAQGIPSLVMLTATPEQMGLEGHFARLRLLDTNKFYDYHAFIKESERFAEVAKIARKLVEAQSVTTEVIADLKQFKDAPDKMDYVDALNFLLEAHGTGRVFFRNTRNKIEKEFHFFPKRKLAEYPLKKMTYSERLTWLISFIDERKNNPNKILLITRSKKLIIDLYNDLKTIVGDYDLTYFHSDLSLIDRDKMAHHFRHPDGAKIMLCTEIGSEGRNFEVASDLILFDIPKNPDLLEQRIGRLDRIGQKRDITIHVPFVVGNEEEALFKWYRDGIGSFKAYARGGMAMFNLFEADIEEAKKDLSLLPNLIEKTKTEYAKHLIELDNGKDILVELNSFNHDHAHKIIDEIHSLEKSLNLKAFVEKMCDFFRIEVEDLDGEALILRPTELMPIPSFPFLVEEGFSVTFDRAKGMRRDDLHFLSWDHPMIEEGMRIIIGNNFGSMAVVNRREPTGKPFLEVNFILESIAPRRWQVDRYFPPTTIRVLIDPQGTDFDDKFSRDQLNERLISANNLMQQKAMATNKEGIKKILVKAEEYAKLKKETIINSAVKNADDILTHEKHMLEQLAKINPMVRQDEIDFAQTKKNNVLQFIKTSEIRIDSIRFIIA